MARTKGASPGSKPAKSSDKNSPRNIKMQETEAAFFSFLEDRKRQIPGIKLADAVAAWKALAKSEKESYRLASKQNKSTQPADSQDQKVYKMLVDDEDSIQTIDIAPVPMSLEQEGIPEGTGGSVNQEPADLMIEEREVICETTEPVEAVKTAGSVETVTTTNITPTAQITTTHTQMMQMQSTVIPQDPDEQQKGPILVEDYFSVEPQQPQGDREGDREALGSGIANTLPPSLQDDESYVMVGADEPRTEITVVCTAGDIDVDREAGGTSTAPAPAPASGAPSGAEVVQGQQAAEAPRAQEQPVTEPPADAPEGPAVAPDIDAALPAQAAEDASAPTAAQEPASTAD